MNLQDILKQNSSDQVELLKITTGPEKYTWTTEKKAELHKVLGEIFNWNSEDKN